MRKLFLIIMALVACSWSLMAQNRYSGTVVDALNNEPLIGVTIMPIGGGQGVATDVDGKFSIAVPSNVHQVKVSYIGYKEQTVKLSQNMTVYLQNTSTDLDDVVVVAYGTANKESLTGSVAVVGSKDIEDRPVTSVTSALEGNAPGVQVNNSTGTPGSSPSIRIRGFNSFNGTAMSPLYVVDGIVFDGDIAEINPSDIESMSVLKDAASCALYGNRGANGVILINTKRAKGQGKVDVTLQVRQGMYTRGLPFYDTLGADQWMETVLDAWANGRVSSGGYKTKAESLRASAQQFVGTMMNNQNIYAPVEGLGANQMFDPETGKLLSHVLPGYTDLRWWDVISQTGYRQEYNVSATGATDKFDVFASMGYLKENGYMLKTDFERFNGRVNVNYNPVSYFRMGANLAASYQDSDIGVADPDELGATSNPFLTDFYAPIQPYYAHDAEGNILYENGEHVWNTQGLNKGNNTAWNQRLDDSNVTSLAVNATLYGTAILPYGFEATVRGNMSRTKMHQYNYMNNIIGSQAGSGGLDLYDQGINAHTFMQTITWNHLYGLHSIDVLLNHENYQYSSDLTALRKSGQLMPDNVGSSNFEDMTDSYESKSLLRTESYLGRARYNYNQKYFGEVSFRRDGTSRFAKAKRWGNFWSIGGSWIISKEKFVQDLNWLNYLKLRVAYGSVGNDAAASIYSYWATYAQRLYNQLGTLIPASIASGNLRWEATKTLDIALEGSLFNDRFNFSIGYFDKRNSDLLYPVTLPASAGQLGYSGLLSSLTQNIGSMANRGWELQFGVDIIRNKDIKWSASIDASFVQNKILRLPNGRDIPSQALFKGKSIYEHYMLEWVGIDKATGHSLYYMNPDSPTLYQYDDQGNLKYQTSTWETTLNTAKSTGHYFEDENGRPLTDRPNLAFSKQMGSSIPTVYGSIGTNFSWKGLNLGLLFTYSLGGKTYNSNYASLMGFNTSGLGALHKDVLKAWTAAPEGLAERTAIDGGGIRINSGDIDPNGIPVNDTFYAEYDSAGSSRFLVSNNYLCLKNLNVSYDLPQKWTDAMLLKGINLGFSVDNLFIVTRQKGLNPQYSFSGGQGAYYVPSRVFSFQLSVKF